jgi:hypothetical protein
MYAYYGLNVFCEVRVLETLMQPCWDVGPNKRQLGCEDSDFMNGLMSFVQE